MKKILIVVSSLPAGGAEKSLISFLSSATTDLLKKYDLDIDLLVMQKKGMFLTSIPEHIHMLSTPQDAHAFWESVGTLLREKQLTPTIAMQKIRWAFQQTFSPKKKKMSIAELKWFYCNRTLQMYPKKYDVAMAYMNGLPSFYVIDKVRAKKKIVWVHNDFDKLGYNVNYHEQFFQKADHIVTISDQCVQNIRKHYPQFSQKVCMLENISSPTIINKMADMFIPEEYDGASVKILSIGRLSPQKGFLDLGLDTVKCLKEKGFSFKWYIVGDGELRSQIINRAEELDISDSVCLLGIKSNPYPYIKHCDVFFQPSHYEGKSIALDEAKILYKPIVVSNYPTAHDSIVDGVNGLIGELSAEDLAAKLELLMNDNDLSNHLISNLSVSEKGNEDEVFKYLALF